MRIISPIISKIIIFLILFSINGNSIAQIINNNKNSENYNSKEHISNIYKFLLAEIALYRNYNRTATDLLKELLEATNSPEVAQILTESAIELEDYPLTVYAAQKWAYLAPNNFKAQLIAIAMLLEEGSPLVEKFLEQAIKADPEQIDNQLSGLLPKLLEQPKQLLLKNLESLAKKNPYDYVVQLCLAQVAAQLDNIPLAKQAVDLSLHLNPKFTHAILLQAKLIRYNDKSDDAALHYLHRQVKKFPHNEELILFYANALLDNDKNNEALHELNNIINSSNQLYALEAHLISAEIYLQKGTLNLEKAKTYLKKLINEEFATSKVAFLLGQIAEKQKDFIEAINWYTSVYEEPYHIISYLRAALLLANSGQLLQAIEILNNTQPSTLLERKQLLLFKTELAIESKDASLALESANEGLKLLPNDIDLLYAHSIAASLNNQAFTAENDLKQILSFQPNNHYALNALGFILSSHPNRQEEAFHYIQQALLLSPDNPTYMDSMGWLLYRMGKISDSLATLANAYKLSDELNIALHFGEVLWVNGQYKQAKNIWKKAWEENPDNVDLLNILKHYNVDFQKSLK